MFLKRDKDCNDLTSGGKSFQSVTDDGINELANISVRPAMLSVSNAFRRG